MGARQQAELAPQHPFPEHQRQYEPDEADEIPTEWDETVVGEERVQQRGAGQKHIKVAGECFPVEEIVRCQHEIPVDRTKVWYLRNFTDIVGDVDDFIETFYLNR